VASWNELVEHIKENYKVADEQDDAIKMVFGVGDGRSQLVFLFHHKLMGGVESWVQIESPVGTFAKTDLEKMVREAGTKVCGGIGATGDVITYRHSLPLTNLDMNEFERPLILVTTTADQLEKEITGGDDF
jgi:hypothetical protein